MTPWTRSTAPFITELASVAGGLMGGAGAPGSGSAPAGNAASQTVANKAKGHKSTVNFSVGSAEGEGSSVGGGKRRGDDEPAPALPADDSGLGLDPALILAVMVFVLVLVAVVALLGR